MSPRALAGPEIQRILALVPWIVAHPGSPKDEIARRFGITVDQLDDDLALVLMIGVPPYSPGDYLDVDEDDDGHVTIRLADYFRRPLRLTPAEGLALLAAGTRAARGAGLRSERAARDRARQARSTRSSCPASSSTSASPANSTRSATRSPRTTRVEIDYWSAGRDELTTRRIDPEVVFFATGEWYVGAYCHRARDERMFRVDRIRAVRPTGETFEPGATGFETGDVYTPARRRPAGHARARARGRVGRRGVSRPKSVTERADGSLEIVLAVSERAWLERLLLRLGPDARVVGPDRAARRSRPMPHSEFSRRYRDMTFRVAALDPPT